VLADKPTGAVVGFLAVTNVAFGFSSGFELSGANEAAVWTDVGKTACFTAIAALPSAFIPRPITSVIFGMPF
jgi:hypothetical protein